MSIIVTMAPSISLNEKYGWNGILSESLLIPMGLFDPVSCRKIRWAITIAITINGRMKWNAKNRVRVALSTANPPHTHSTSIFPR